MPDSALTPAAKEPIDWSQVRTRLERATALLDAREHRGETPAQTLARRARDAARPLAAPAPETPALAVVAFELNGQTFAIEERHVSECVFLRNLTRLPGLPEFVRGVVNLRSRIIAAMDLRPLLQLGPGAAPAGEKLLVIEFDGAAFGLVVDRVLGPRVLAETLHREVPGLNDRHLRGLAADGTIVLSIPALFPDLVVDGRDGT